MHPTTASYLAKSHARDLEVQAAKDRLAKSVRAARAEERQGAGWGLRLRRAIPLVHHKASGATTA